MTDLDRMLAERLNEVRDAHTAESGLELHARRHDLFRRVRRRRTIKGAGALAVATAVVIAGFLFVPEVVDRRAAPPAGDVPAVHVETIEGVPNNSLVTTAGREVWVSSRDRLLEIFDGRPVGNGSPLDKGCCDDLEWGEAGLWRTASPGRQVLIERLDPESGAVVNSIECGGCKLPLKLSVGDDEVWAYSFGDPIVRRLDLSSGALKEHSIVPESNEEMVPLSMTDDGERLWAVLADGAFDSPDPQGMLMRLDLIGDELRPTASIPLGGCPMLVEASGGRVWVADPCDGVLLVADPDDPKDMRTVELDDFPLEMVAGLGYGWLVYPDNDTVTRHDPVTGEQIGGPIQVGKVPTDIAASDTAVWVANRDDGTVSRITLGEIAPLPTETPTEPAIPSEHVGIFPAPFDQLAVEICNSRDLHTPEATAVAFADELLGWTDPQVQVMGRGEAGGMVLHLTGPELDEDLGRLPRAVVRLVLQQVPGAPDCWWITSVGPGGGGGPRVSIDVEGRYATVGFDRLQADRVWVALAYPSVGDDKEVPATEGSVRFDLMANPQEPGIFLVLWKDPSGVVFEEVGVQIPAGDFSTE
jgi:streptogramin lyase